MRAQPDFQRRGLLARVRGGHARLRVPPRAVPQRVRAAGEQRPGRCREGGRTTPRAPSHRRSSTGRAPLAAEASDLWRARVLPPLPQINRTAEALNLTEVQRVVRPGGPPSSGRPRRPPSHHLAPARGGGRPGFTTHSSPAPASRHSLPPLPPTAGGPQARAPGAARPAPHLRERVRPGLRGPALRGLLRRVRRRTQAAGLHFLSPARRGRAAASGPARNVPSAAPAGGSASDPPCAAPPQVRL